MKAFVTLALALAPLALAAPQPVAATVAASNTLEARAAEATTLNNFTGVSIRPPGGASFVSAVDTFRIPTIQAGGDKVGSVDGASVHIDNRVGVGCEFGVNNTLQYAALCQALWGGSGVFFQSFLPAAGDSVTASLRLVNSSAAVAVLRNGRTGQSATNTVTAPGPSATATGGLAGFYTTYYYPNGTAGSSFRNVTYSGASATTGSGAQVGLAGADVVLQQNSQGRAVSQVQVTGPNSFWTFYTG